MTAEEAFEEWLLDQGESAFSGISRDQIKRIFLAGYEYGRSSKEQACRGCLTAKQIREGAPVVIHDDAFGHCDDCGREYFQSDYEHTCKRRHQCFYCFAVTVLKEIRQ